MTDTTGPVDASSPQLPRLIPPQERRDEADTAATVDVIPAVVKPAEQLGFQMRFEGGHALLALEGKRADDGVEVRRALFEVPDVAFPLDVTGGALRFQSKRLTLRAVELAVTWDALFVPEALARHGLSLVRERSRAGGLELVVAVDGPAGPVPLRARCIFAPVGDGGVALVLHEVIGFAPLPRRRLDLAPALLDALRFPGGLPARAMVRRAEPFRAVLARLLPQYGWKVPSLGDVRVHEAVLGKGEIVLRAWSGNPPEGWKAPRDLKKGPLQDAISLAVFADGLVGAGDLAARLRLVDRLIDEAALSSGAMPFAAEVLRSDPRRMLDGDDLIRQALVDDDEHLGLLSAWAETENIEPRERARRLLALSRAAEANDEPWVAGRAALAASRLAADTDDDALAIEAAEAAVEADPSVAEAGMTLARLLVRRGDGARALSVGRSALERVGAGSMIEADSDVDAAEVFAIELASVAREVEGLDAARLLLRRALRQRERPDALVPLVELEIEGGALERAAEGLARLLIVVDQQPGLKKQVELLAARLAEQRGDRDGARAHLLAARDLDPRDARVALHLSRLAEDVGDGDRALEALSLVIVDDEEVNDSGRSDVVAARFAAARLLVRKAQRHGGSDRQFAERARSLLARLPDDVRHDAATRRLEAEARATLGDTAPLGVLLLADAPHASDRSTSMTLWRHAARLLLEAGSTTTAAQAISAALLADAADGEVADIVVAHADTAGLVAAIAEGVAQSPAGHRDDVVDGLRGIARRLAANGRPRAALDVLAGQPDRASCELRASCAGDANDTEAEVQQRRALLELVEPHAQPALHVRLAVLLGRLLRHDEAADAWVLALEAGASVDVDAWQRAAVAANDPLRLARVLHLDEATPETVASPLLRDAIAHVQDDDDKRRLLALLAARNDDVADVQRWLDAARALPADAAAAAFVGAAHLNARVDWLFEGLDILEASGDVAGAWQALHPLMNDGRFADDKNVAERAFDLAVRADDTAGIEHTAATLLARTDLGADVVVQLRQRLHGVWGGRGDRARELALLHSWLDHSPEALEPLEALVQRATEVDADAHEAEQAVGRLAAAPNNDVVRQLVITVADSARERGHAVEASAREQLLRFDLDDSLRERNQRRLVDLCIRDERFDRAIELLHALLGQAQERGAPDVVHAGLWLRIADIEEDQRQQPAAAIDALRALLQHAPADADASRRLLALLLEAHDDEGLAAECLRRASWIPSSPERTDLLLRAAQVARTATRFDEARAIGLRALRNPPFSRRALDELLDLARATGSRRLAIRARLAAAACLEHDDVVEASKHAAEAGGVLAGVLRRLRYGVVAFEFAERCHAVAGTTDLTTTRMLVELHRTLGDGAATIRHLDRLIDAGVGKEQARLLEARAEVRATLLGDDDGAIADRRAALALDPAYSAAARALGAQLDARGEPRAALDVERAWIDASCSGSARGTAYAQLAARADATLTDADLVAELCAVALADGEYDNLTVHRRLVAARERLGDNEATLAAVSGLHSFALDPLERLSTGSRRAELLSALANDDAAAATLKLLVDDNAIESAVLGTAHGAGYDVVVRRLATLLAARGSLADAAEVVLRALSWLPHAPAFQPKNAVLEQAATWLDDADAEGPAHAVLALQALSVLGDAAVQGGLTIDGEVRRARLAEELQRHDIACIALQSLISRNVEVGPNAQRLAMAAEAVGDLPRALASWELALADDDQHVDAWLASERLAAALGDAAPLRAAREALVRLQCGSVAEQSARAASCAEDILARQGDVGAAIDWFDRARALSSTSPLRQRLLTLCLRPGAPASADTVALAVLDEMHSAGDTLTPAWQTERASLRLQTASDGDDDAAASALLDVLAAARGGLDTTMLQPLVASIVKRAPHVAAEALRSDPSVQLLRDALVGALDDERINLPLLASLAETRRGDVAVHRAAARREDVAGLHDDAVRRLLAAASAANTPDATEANLAVDEAARIAITGGRAVILEYLDGVRPGLQRRVPLRDAALTLLRDADQWSAVASVLADAIDVSAVVEQRRLRLELVAVLRDGVTTPDAQREAVQHLEALVTADIADREAWGELFECLDDLQDKEALQQAMGQRAAALSPTEQFERRQLVRRRAELLLGLGRPNEGIAALGEVRPAGDLDDDLKTLAADLHRALDATVSDDGAGSATIGWLADELAAASQVVDAEAILALDARTVHAVKPGLRLAARLITFINTEATKAIGSKWFDTSWTDEALRQEAVEAVKALLTADSAALAIALVVGLGEASLGLSPSAALCLTDALYAETTVVDAVGATLATAFAVAGFAHRLQTSGPRAAAIDVERLSGRARHAAILRRSSRLAEHSVVAAAATALGVVVEAPHALQARVQSEYQLVAATALKSAVAARPVEVVVAHLRHGSPLGDAMAAALNAPQRQQLARRLQTLSLRGARRGARLKPRLSLASLVNDPAAELILLAQVAHDEGDVVVEADALDLLVTLRPATPAELVRRADAAFALGDADAHLRASSAAAAADTVADFDNSVRLRRRAIESFLRRAERDALGRELLALATTAPEGVSGDQLRAEARSTAEAARLPDIVDAILQASEAALVDVRERLQAATARIELRLKRNDPLGAFDALVAASTSIGDDDARLQLRERAWQVACSHGLTAQALEVVDDNLARAGLLAALGRRSEAMAVAVAINDAAAWWLVADCARADGDHVAEERALAQLAERGVADDGALIRLAEGAQHRGDINDAARRALALIERGPTSGRVRLLADCASAAIEPPLHAAAVSALLDVGDNAEVDVAVRGLALQRAAELATGLNDATLRRATRMALVRLRDDDDSWTEALLADLVELSGDELMVAVRRLLARPAVLRAVARRATGIASIALGDAFSALVRAGEAQRIVDVLQSLVASAALCGVHADALEALSRSRDAADVLMAALARAEGAERRAHLLRASVLYVAVGAFGAAARALQALERDDYDDAVIVHARDVLTRAARDGALGDAAELAAVVGRTTGDPTFIASALSLADAAGGDTALRIAAWRLRDGDARALSLLSRHGVEGSPAHAWFGAWHSLRHGERTFSSSAPPDFAAITKLVDNQRTLIEPTAPMSTLQRARRGRHSTRALAWKQLAAETAATDELGSARLLIRAGVPMTEAPLLVRLAVDPTLANDDARCAAIAAGLIDVDVARQAAVVSAFDAAVARGASTARERLAVDAVAARKRPTLVVEVDRASVGEAVDVHAIVAGLGRHPARGERSLAAALLRVLGNDDLAAAVDPTVVRVDGQRTNMSRQQLLALRFVDDGLGLRALGQLRLSQLAGPRIDIEERIAAIATSLGRTDLLAESLRRQARLHRSKDAQSALLVRYAEVLLDTDAVAATRAARAAFALDATPAAAEMMVRAADVHDDAVDVDEALRAQLNVVHDPKARTALVRRRAHVLAHRLHRAADALQLLDERIADAPAFALELDKSSIFERVLSRPLDAALILLAGIDADDTLGPDERCAHRRHAALLLAGIVEDGDMSITLAVSTLSLCFTQDGDVTALDEAEALARSRHVGAALASVLELRLRETEDIDARRELVLEHARLLHDLEDVMGAIAMLEAQAVADPIDLGARLVLAGWYLKDRRILDAALAFESAARIPGLPAVGYGPPARAGASLLAAIGDLERAGPLAELAVTAGVADLQVLSVCEAWHRANERWLAVDELLGKELEHIDDPRRAAHVWMERASIRRDRLNDENGTRKALSKVLDILPDHPRALQVMREDAARADTWGPLRTALLRAVDAVENPQQQAAWLREIATIDADRLSDKKAAAATVDRALVLVPDNVDTLVLKATLMVKAGQLDGLSAVMDKIEKKGRAHLPGLLHLVRGDALLVAGDRPAGQAAFRLATEDPATSAKAWDRLIDMDDGTREALPLLDEARKATVETRRRLQLWRKEQRLRTKLGDDDGAIDAAEQVLQLDLADSDALAVVTDAFRRRRKLRELVPYLIGHARAVEAGTESPERARRLAAVGVFCLDELGQEGNARQFLEEALSVDANQPTALLRMADIAWASRDDERALVLLDRITPELWATAPDDGSKARTAAELYLRRARCAWTLGAPDVRERLRQVLRVDASHIAALDMLAKVAQEQHDDDSAEMALESLAKALELHDDPVRLAAVLVDLATLRLRRGNPNDALTAAERAFELNATNLAVLQAVAEAREVGGRPADAAEAWRRLAAVRSGSERIVALERRVQALVKANRTKDVVDAWIDLFTETGDPLHKEAAVTLATTSGLPQLLTRLGVVDAVDDHLDDDTIDHMQTQAMPAAPGETGALAIQLRANLDDGDADNALAIALEAQVNGPLDQESARLAIEAALRTQKFDIAVELAEARLQASSDTNEVLAVGLAAGRVARDKLHDDDRAAALLYQAHQADAEDVEVRLELTELYARIPRLASHAVTGILQLLRRTPTDARVFALAARLAADQGQLERATSLRAIEALLRGKGVPQELLGARSVDERPTAAVLPLDKEALATRLAPTGWGGPLQQLLQLLGVPLEVAVSSAPVPPDAKLLLAASPRAAASIDRIERLLPGRPVQFVIADVDKPTFAAGAVATVALPRELLANEPALFAAIARGIAVVRFGGMLTELLRPGSDAEVLRLLRAGLLGDNAKDARSEQLTASLRDDEKAAAVALARQCLAGNADLAGVLQVISRACDRFVLVATGSPVAALQSSTLPTLLKESPQRAMVLIQSSVRALELCAFVARDNTWLLRRQHLLQ